MPTATLPPASRRAIDVARGDMQVADIELSCASQGTGATADTMTRASWQPVN